MLGLLIVMYHGERDGPSFEDLPDVRFAGSTSVANSEDFPRLFNRTRTGFQNRLECDARTDASSHRGSVPYFSSHETVIRDSDAIRYLKITRCEYIDVERIALPLPKTPRGGEADHRRVISTQV